MLSHNDVQTIATLLMKRVAPRDAEEGVAIAQLVERLAQSTKAPTPPVLPILDKEDVKALKGDPALKELAPVKRKPTAKGPVEGSK